MKQVKNNQGRGIGYNSKISNCIIMVKNPRKVVAVT